MDISKQSVELNSARQNEMLDKAMQTEDCFEPEILGLSQLIEAPGVQDDG